MSAPVPYMTGTALSRNPWILASGGNPASYVRAVGSGNLSPVLSGWKPWSDLSPIGHGLVPETLEHQKSSASFLNWRKADLPSSH